VAFLHLFFVYSWNKMFFPFKKICQNCSILFRNRWSKSILAILVFLLPNILNYLSLQSFDFGRNWWRLLQKCVVRIHCTRYLFFRTRYLMFLWQVEFWLAENVLITLHGSRAVYFIRHGKSIIAFTYCLCCVFHLHCSRRHTYGTENQ
jgi:hypothetical protein